MKGDFTRDTFKAGNHYQQVLMQQGRVQVDADWNEQAAIGLHRDETTARDIIGKCGGPEGNAAFGIVKSIKDLPDEQQNMVSSEQVQKGDILFTAGNYYVDGILCEVDRPFLYSNQPDRFNVGILDRTDIRYLLYLDVWQRHITALEDDSVREVALGGPDTTTRVKTVWQVKSLDVYYSKVPQDDPFLALTAPSNALLFAKTNSPDSSPCQVPPSAGYTGLENQLYRVEIHIPGSVLNEESPTASSDPGTQIHISFPGGKKQSAWWDRDTGRIIIDKTKMTEKRIADILELHPNDHDSKNKQNGKSKTSGKINKPKSISVPVIGKTEDKNYYYLLVDTYVLTGYEQQTFYTMPSYKWSRDNGAVAFPIRSMAGKEIEVDGMKPEYIRKFKGAFAEILDDRNEQWNHWGQLCKIVDVKHNMIVLESEPRTLSPEEKEGVDPAYHPKLRLWDGYSYQLPVDEYCELEKGILLKFDKTAEYRTGQYWQIPARVASKGSQISTIEWPCDKGEPIPQPPKGIEHHYCPLAIVKIGEKGPEVLSDCRNIFPPLTSLHSQQSTNISEPPCLFYLGGDGQEVMPDASQTAAVLPNPLRVVVMQNNKPVSGAMVKFQIMDSQYVSGLLVDFPNDRHGIELYVSTDENGIASCAWELDCTNWDHNVFWRQRVQATLFNENNKQVEPSIIFNANLSVASKVGYMRYGWKGEYFHYNDTSSIDLSKADLVFTRIDEEINFDWGNSSPAEEIKPNNFAVRWTGLIRPDFTADYTFYTTTDDGVRLWVGDELVINQWIDQRATEHVGVKHLEAGVLYEVKMEYYENGFDAVAKLHWSSANANLKKTVVPALKTINVHDALDLLFQKSYTSVEVKKKSCWSVGEGGDYLTLEEANDGLKNEKDVCLCLLPGEHPIKNNDLTMTKSRQIKITGSGSAASTILLPGKLQFQSKNVILRDLTIKSCSTGTTSSLILGDTIDVSGCVFDKSENLSDIAFVIIAQNSSSRTELHWNNNHHIQKKGEFSLVISTIQVNGCISDSVIEAGLYLVPRSIADEKGLESWSANSAHQYLKNSFTIGADLIIRGNRIGYCRCGINKNEYSCFNSLIVTDNIFGSVHNVFFAQKISLNGNHFVVSDLRPTVAVSLLSNQGTIVGNQTSISNKHLIKAFKEFPSAANMLEIQPYI
jgi:hypothetical protein